MRKDDFTNSIYFNASLPPEAVISLMAPDICMKSCAVYELSLLFIISVQEYLKEFKFEFQNELEVSLTFSKSREIAVDAEFMSQGIARTKTQAKAELSF
jgi:hypothetical protein